MKHLRNLLVWVGILVCLLALAGLSSADKIPPDDWKAMQQWKSELQLKKQARMIHESVLTIDTHQDTPLIIEKSPVLFGEEYDLGQRYQTADYNGFICRQVDFPRMKEGGLDAAFFVAFLSQGDRDEAGNQAAQEHALSLIELIHEKVGEYPNLAGIATKPQDAYIFEKQKKRAIYIGIENGYAIGNDLDMIETYYDLGVRYITLCHSSNNDISDSSTDPDGPEHGGLSDFGKDVVKEMNQLGMMVDVSHASDDAVWDVLAF